MRVHKKAGTPETKLLIHAATVLAAPVSSVSTSPRPVLAPSVVTALQVEACLHDLLFARPLAPRAEAFACGFAFRNSPTGALDDRPEAQTLMLIGSDYNAM